MPNSHVRIGKDAIECYTGAIQDTIDLQEECENEILETLEAHNLGSDQLRLKGSRILVVGGRSSATGRIGSTVGSTATHRSIRRYAPSTRRVLGTFIGSEPSSSTINENGFGL